MTIDEAISHAMEVAEQNETQADKIGRQLIGSAIDKYATDCRECAADHRQLAEWLRELKQWRKVYGVCPSYEMCIPECKEGYNAQIAEYKRLLKATTSDIHDMLTERFGVICEFCKWYDSKNADCAKPRNGSGAWCCEYGCSRYADEVKELIGETNDEP